MKIKSYVLFYPMPVPIKILNFLPGCAYCTGMLIYEPRHEISNNVVCASSKAADQPTHMRSLIRAFVSRLNIL